MSIQPDADELRIRSSLRALVDGTPAAVVPPLPPGYQPAAPAPARDDWWDRLYADDDQEPEEEPEAEPEEDEPQQRGRWWKAPASAEEPQAEEPATAPARRPATRQSLTDAYARIPARIRWLAYHSSAAAAGWHLGWVQWSTDATAWITATGWTHPHSLALYALGGGAVALYRRLSRSLAVVAWAAAIPVSSATAGLLLYGTGA
ncbi:hypothetical protein [Streptomyces sp. MJP52]|uniref:hypothetical protein n=1 Tax=Streptomyces sp. MJP52 TaxID=2940555 RepID=UPI00247560A4|nr:hypothetical protein [Streptomyces sp. MJP52]MDH6226229.1 hypothetical protein [Streptomyces sp. MJP52]